MKNTPHDNPNDLAFFVSHLNRIYCAKSHLQERLPELTDLGYFDDLMDMIMETLKTVDKQLVRMDQIFVLLDLDSVYQDCPGAIGLMEEAFDHIHQHRNDQKLRDRSLLFYLYIAESIETASFKLLRLAVPDGINPEVRELLQANSEETKKDLKFIGHVVSKHFDKGSGIDSE